MFCKVGIDAQQGPYSVDHKSIIVGKADRFHQSLRGVGSKKSSDIKLATVKTVSTDKIRATL